jgi:hypothetical protein
MAFVTGSATSLADLLTAFQNACTANGYSLTGNVLSKGSLFAQVAISGSYLAVNAGSGQSAGVLTGASDVGAATLGMTTSGSTIGTYGFTFPMTYSVHIGTAPDEVYLIVNLNGNQYQYLAFGQSSVTGLVGSGNWFAGSRPSSSPNTNAVEIGSEGGTMRVNNLNNGLFQGRNADAASQNGAVDHQLDSVTWSVDGAWHDAWSLLSNSPSGWNGESILIPVTVYAVRPSSFKTAVAELAHARFVMLDNLSDQQIITLGTDRWKVYPWWKRGLRGVYTADTGTLGHAIRYDGP